MVFFHAFILSNIGVTNESKADATTLEGVVSRYFKACQSGNYKEALHSLKRVEDWKVNHGLRNVPSVATALWMANNAHLFKNIPGHQRLILYERIAELSPDDPSIQWRLIKAQLITNPFDFKRFYKRILLLRAAVLTNFSWASIWGGQILFTLMISLFMTTYLFALVMMIKYFHILVVNLQRLARLSFNKSLVAILIVMMFFIPVYFNVGVAWLPLFWLTFMWLVFSKQEKVMVLIFLAAFSVLCLEFRNVGNVFTTASNKDSYLLYLANYSQLEPDVSLERLKNASSLTNKDADIPFTLGLVAKRRGDYKEAETSYLSAIRADSGFAECMNNLANLYLLGKGLFSNNVGQAQTWYKKAIKINPDRPEFYYNLSISFPPYDRSRMEYLRKAKILNPELVNDWLERSSKSPTPVVDCLLPVNRIWHRAFILSNDSSNLTLLLWRFFLNSPLDMILIVPLILLILIFGFYKFQRKFILLQPCHQCGQFYPTFQRFGGLSQLTMALGGSNPGLCPQCVMLREEPGQLDAAMVKHKKAEIVRYQRQRKIKDLIAGIFPAGGMLILNGSVAKGVLLSFLFYSFLCYFLISHKAFSDIALWFYGFSDRSFIPLILATALYLSCLIPSVSAFTKRGVL